MSEEWRAVPGYEGLYEVSDEGRVRSLDRWVVAGWTRYIVKGQIRALSKQARSGYLKLTLANSGARRTFNVHELVALTFIGPRPSGLDICHNNGDMYDNRAGNLRYDTTSSNIIDAIEHGTHWPSRKTHCVNGHEFTPENTRPRKNRSGRIGRQCRACMNASRRSRRARARPAA